MDDLKARLKGVLSSLGLRPRKFLGQNFMINPGSLDAIVEAIGLEGRETVLEIGSGFGFLTERILEKAASVIAVEKDPRFCEFLRSRFGTGGRVRVLAADILRVNWEKVLGSQKVICTGNIPYQISSPLIRRMEKGRRFWKKAVFTLQKEFALRLVAPAGSSSRSALSCWMEFQASMEILKDFPPSDFYPPPRVVSSLVRISFFDRPGIPLGIEGILESCIRRGFQQKRKKLSNALEKHFGGLSKGEIITCLREGGIDPKNRAEDLRREDWLRFALEIKNRLKAGPHPMGTR